MNQQFIIPIVPTQKLSFREKLRCMFLIEKLDNPFVIALLLFAGAGIALAVAKSGLITGVMAVVIMIAVPVVYCIVAYPVLV